MNLLRKLDYGNSIKKTHIHTTNKIRDTKIQRNQVLKQHYDNDSNKLSLETDRRCLRSYSQQMINGSLFNSSSNVLCEKTLFVTNDHITPPTNGITQEKTKQNRQHWTVVPIKFTVSLPVT